MRRGMWMIGAVTIAGGAAALWLGCSSSSGGSAGVDPGGTFGAEVVVHIVGAGRVTSDPWSLDCPSGCFHRFIFDPNTTATVGLKANASAGWKFSGWTFNATTSPTRGKGPEACQPFTRATATAPAGVDTNAETISLPPGTTQGTPPAGQESSCTPFTAVPTAYDLTATFTFEGLPSDAGPNDAGLDGGIDIPIYEMPAGSSVGPLFYYSGRLYWQWNLSGQSAISYGDTTGGSRTDYVSLGSSITAFNVSTSGYGLAYQNGNGAFGYYSLPPSTPVPLASPPSCVAMAATYTSGYYAYCRTTTNVVRWPLTSVDAGQGPQVVATTPNGPDLAVDTSRAYISDPGSGNIDGFYVSDGIAADGGIPPFTSVATGQSSPFGIQIASSYAYWMDAFGDVSQAYGLSASGITVLGTKPSVKAFTTYAQSYVWFVSSPAGVGAATIWRVSTSGGSPVAVRQGLTDVRSITNDGSYVYWATGDGKIYSVYGF